jgi:ATP-dependent exoDNAse (exonuclease V) beta subunit
VAERWTREQRAAILERRHTLLAANAGTGKTATVVAKVRWRTGQPIEESVDGPVPPCEDPCDLGAIAAITFTEKAARDLRRKLRETMSGRGAGGASEIDRAFVGTIHGFCGEVLREHALRLDIDPGFRVMDAREASLRLSETVRSVALEALERGERDAMDLVREKPLDRFGPWGNSTTDLVRAAMRDLRWHRDRFEAWMPRVGAGGGEPELDLAVLRTLAAEGAVADLGEAEERALAWTATVHRLAHRSLARWLDLLERENRRDFDSLVLDVRRLLTRPEHAPALDALRRRFRLLVVDEFQDTDTAQRDIAFAIAGLLDDASTAGETPDPAPATQLVLVGDPKQSIYGFRDADVRVWNEARETMECRGAVLRLTRNFRCDPAIVALVNRACEPAFASAGSALAAVDPGAVVEYDELTADVKRWSGAGVEWLATEAEGPAAERERKGAALVASRVAFLLRTDTGTRVRDAEGNERAARPSDVAVLALRRKTLAEVERFLRELEIPVYNASSGGLVERPEVRDAVTALRLADNPRDDLRAFAFLRSPFVGLRDEVIARLRLDPSVRGGSLLRAARRWLDAVTAGEVESFAAPESPWIEPTERDALRRGLEALEEARALVGRAEPAEILEAVLERTHYRLHLRLRRGTDEALANLERLKAVLGEFRALGLADFLRAWDASADDREADLGTAQLPEAAEGAVLLTTIHKAKGLEWPIVVLAGAEAGTGRTSLGAWETWTDRELGPVLLPKKDDRGDRSEQAERKRLREEEAEQARLLYVALTRPRNRLLVAAPTGDPGGHAGWIARGLFSWTGPGETDGRDGEEPPDESPRGEARAAGGAPTRGGRAEADDPATGTGRQLDVFGLHDPPADEGGQLNLLNPENHAPDLQGRTVAAGGDIPLTVWRAAEPIQATFAPAPVLLDWLDGIEPGGEGPELAPIADVGHELLRSATDLALERRDRMGWLQRYRHGVVPGWQFAGDGSPAGSGEEKRAGSPDPDPVPAVVRGTIVHRALESAAGDEEDLAALLDEAIGGLEEEDALRLAAGDAGGALRALREEVGRVLGGEAWRAWTSGEHHRELAFVHFATPDEWHQGRLDLFVPPRPGSGGPSGEARVVDFKTNRVSRSEIASAARRYELQARVYREAVRAILAPPGDPDGGPDVRVTLHFTHADRSVDL